jgi:hypothetical protein
MSIGNAEKACAIYHGEFRFVKANKTLTTILIENSVENIISRIYIRVITRWHWINLEKRRLCVDGFT